MLPERRGPAPTSAAAAGGERKAAAAAQAAAAMLGQKPPAAKPRGILSCTHDVALPPDYQVRGC